MAYAGDSHSNFSAAGFTAGAGGLAFAGALVLTQGVVQAAQAARRARSSRNLEDWATALSVQQAMTNRALAVAQSWRKRALEAEKAARAAEASRAALVQVVSGRKQ